MTMDISRLSLRLVAVSIVLASVSGSTDDADDDDESVKPEGWVQHGGFVILLIAVFQMFYALALVVEEYFVPALNTMCEKYNIPDDVAGATFMAAGASAPELFAALISLFITHSTLGVGTIIGSELFNHLIITAGSIYYSTGGIIQTEPRFVSREAFFYGSALICLLWVLSQTSDSDESCYDKLSSSQKDMVDKDSQADFICVAWYKPLVLISVYGLYALVCGNYQTLIRRLCPFPEDKEVATTKENIEEQEKKQVEMRAMRDFLEHNDEEAATLERCASNLQKFNSTPNVLHPHNLSQNRMKANSLDCVLNEPTEKVQFPKFLERGHSLDDYTTYEKYVNDPVGAAFDTFLHGIAPKSMASGVTANLNTMIISSHSMGCYLWKKSQFLSKLSNSPRAWQLRWCHIDVTGFKSMKYKDSKRGMHWYKAFIVEVVDEKGLIFKLQTKSRVLFFKAPNSEIMTNIQKALSKYQEIYSSSKIEKQRQLRLKSIEVLSEEDQEGLEVDQEVQDDEEDHVHHESLMDWPETRFSVFCHIITLPIKASLHYTIPDVRLPGNEEKFGRAIFGSVFYLALFSFVMTDSMELLGPFFGISDFIMGVVFAAAGTSFPNVFASMVVARQGLGNAAISNALGGNVFNILIGLGVPWFLFAFLGTEYVNKKNFTYTGLHAGGIVFPILLLLAFIVVFVFVLICTGWKLYTIHAHIAILIYLGFLVWVFMTSMLTPNLG